MIEFYVLIYLQMIHGSHVVMKMAKLIFMKLQQEHFYNNLRVIHKKK